MRKILLSSLVTGTALLASLAAHASDGTISVTGSVTSTTCTLGGTSGSYTVGLPTVSTSAFKAAGATAGATPFTITGTGCTGGTTATAYFEPGANTDLATGYLMASATTAAPKATGVEVEFVNPKTSTALNLAGGSGAQNAIVSNITGGGFSTTYLAQYVSTAATVGAGNFNSSITYSMVYQ